MMGAQGGGGSGGGGSANVYLPKNQGAADDTFAGIMKPLADLAGNAGAGTPAAWSWPQAQSMYPGGYNSAAQFLMGDILGGNPTLYDSGVGNAYGSAVNAGNLYQGLMPDIYNQTARLSQGAGAGLDYAGQALGAGFNPLYQQMVNTVSDNPYYAGAMAGAQQGAGLGTQGADRLYGAGMGLLESGFDPRAALFDRSQQRLMDQSGAATSMMGLGSSPYGAGVMSNALGNFDIDWQNQQLARQAQAAGAASPLFQAAPGLAAGSAALPSGAFMNQINNILNTLKAQQVGQGLGSEVYRGLLGASGTGIGQAQGLGQNIAGTTAQLGGLPYTTGATIGQNALTAQDSLQKLLSGATNLGNNQFVLPMDVLSKLSGYMGQGQDASRIGAAIGQQGFNQTAQGLGGLLSGANTLFNPTSGMLGPSLFGGSTAASIGAPIVSSMGSWSPLATGAATGGSGMLGLLPMAASL